MCVGAQVRRSKTGLSSRRVSLKLSSDACTGGKSLIPFHAIWGLGFIIFAL